MEIAVVGGGHGAYAAAADLAEQGHAVRLWRRDAEAFGPVLSQQSVRILDVRGERRVPLALASTDLGKVVNGAALIVAPLPAPSQSSVGAALAPYLVDGQVVFMPPGTFGSYVMAEAVRRAGSRAHVSFAEAGTLPWLARKRGQDLVAISARATRLPSGVFPGIDAAHAFAVIEAAFPAVERCCDALDAALQNAGPIIHPPLILMNAGPLEYASNWDIHNEGTQPAIRRVTDALDAERIAVRQALSYPPPHFPLADHYAPDGEEWMYGNAAHEKLVDSGDWREPIDLHDHRYMREDVVHGLTFMTSVARKAGVHTPLADGLLAIAAAVLEENLVAHGRTLQELGLAPYSIEDLKLKLSDGFNES